MVEMNSHITIGAYVFKSGKLNGVKIKSSRKVIGDTASIFLPNYYHGADRLDTLINEGDAVVIQLGYDGNYKTEFEGYVKEIKPNTPLEIVCDDEIWNLKQEQVSMSWKETTLHDVLRYLVPNVEIECININLSPFRLDKVSKAEALAKIKKMYGLDIYFRGKKLYVGFAYQESGLSEVKYHFQKNAIHGDLTFKTKKSVKIKVKAVSILKSNERLEVEVGDDDGELRTLHFYNITKIEELKALAEEKLELLKYDGYRGKMKAKGVPFVTHSTKAQLDDDKYPMRFGKYFIDEIDTTYNKSGFNRTIQLGRKAS